MFFTLWKIPSNSGSSEVFCLSVMYFFKIMSWCCLLSNALHLLIGSYDFSVVFIIDFWMLNQSYIWGLSGAWPWCIILFTCCCIQFVNILSSILVSRLMKHWSVIFFFVMSLTLILELFHRMSQELFSLFLLSERDCSELVLFY